MVTSQKEQILVIIPDAQINFLLERVLKSMGYSVALAKDETDANNYISLHTPSLVVLSEKLTTRSGLEFAQDVLQKFPAVPVLLFVTDDRPEILKQALKIGVSDYLALPLRSDDILRAVQNSLRKTQQRKEWVLLESKRATANLQKRVNELETLARLGRSITSSLDLDSVLASVVDAAVEMTNAEEGSLLLLDENTGEMYMRAARNFQEEFVRTFRLPIQDTLAGGVLRTGKPILLDEQTPQKIKTAYLVHSLVYVPLQIHGHVFGVLGVDNRSSRPPLKERDVSVLSALAEFAVIAIENARLYSNIIQERNKMETILTRIQDGVIVVDQDHRLALVNQAAQSAFNVTDQVLLGKPFDDVFTQPELRALVDKGTALSNRMELTVEDGRTFSTQLTPVQDVGLAITLHDITYLKKLERIKNDFVSTVSHDLRSPLTAILGYVELIEKAGATTEMQRDFIRRVQVSVHNISSLVDDLLNLGRIEAGFDTRKENVFLDQMVRFSIDTFQKLMSDRKQNLRLELPETCPPLFANPIQIRQMVDNLIDNAIKYTPEGGNIQIRVEVEQNQVILQVRDTGIGIPAVDLPYIFDKFYRASNASGDVIGTGLGLSIVKSIVENHQGRIWVDSVIDRGTSFTVVLPIQQA